MGNKKVLSKATRELNKTKRFAAPKNIIVDPKGQWAHPGEITRIPSDTITMQGVPYPVMAYPNIGEPQMMYPGGEYYYPGADYVDEYPQMQDGGAIPVIEDAGSYSAEGYWIPDWEAMKKQAKELNAKTVKTKSGSIIYFDSNWDVQNVDDNPQMKRGGTPKSLVKMPKPSKKGLASKKFSRSLEATNKLFTENYLFAKPKSRKRKVFDPNAADYQEGGEAGCPPGYAYNPVTGECIEWNPTVWSSEEQSTSYDPVGDVIYMNPNDRPEGMSDEEYQQMYQDQLEHEQLHRLQWLNGDLKGQSGTPLRMPSTVDNQDYEGEHYYDRRGQEEAYLHNLWNQQNPDLARFIPSNVVYNKEINPVMYELPWTTEGEARGYEDALHSGMESFFPKKQEGGDPGKGFKKRLMKRYPGMQGIYGPEGENLNIVKDPNYDAASEPYNAGNIEFMFPGLPQVSYPNKKDETLPDYVYVNPSPDKYTSVYNPRGANRGDIFLDMLHGMRDDQNYEVLLQNFDKAVRDARGEDMQYFYEQAVANEGYTDSQEQYNDNYVDSQLRAQLAPGTLGMFSHGRKDYRMERKYDSPEMKAAAKEIKKYLKTPKEDYVETELTPEEIEEYRKGGFIVEDISVPSLTMQKGGDPDPKKKKTSRIEPFITSDPDEYAFRKAAYDDSLHVANKYNSKQPRTSKYTLYKPIVGKSFPGKRASVKREYIPYIPRPLDTYDVSGESPAWEKFRRENMHLRDRMIENQPIGFVTEKSVYDSRGIRTPFGVKTFTLPGEHQAKEFDRKPRYKRPVQPVIFKEPVTHQEKKKPVEHKYPTSRKPVVDNTKQKPPEGKIVVGKEEVQQLDPNTGVVTTVINPVYEDAMMPIQTLPPARVNHTLQKFIGEPLPVTVQEEIPEEELLDEEIPEEEIPEEEMYGEEEVDGEYVDAGRKRLFPNIYVDTHGRKLKYTTYRLRKHGHSGDLIKKKGVDYMYFPKIERGPSTHFWMDYKQEGGAAASPFDLDPEHMKRYLADLRKQENSIRKGYKNGMWYPHASLEGGADTIAYGHKLTPNDSALRRGITEEQALKLQEQDVLKNQALAKKQVDKQFGTGTFDNLPQDSQMLLVDYQYNLGTLSGFPKFVKGVVEGNKEQMLAQHTRYGAGKPLTKRNEWTVDVINNMEIPKPYDPMGQITIPLANVPDATNVVQPVILEGPKEAIELELTPEEIKEYARGGFIVEDVSVPTLTQAQEGGSPDPKTNFYTVEGSDGVYRKVNGKWEVDWNRSGKFQPLSKGDVKERSAILNKKAKPLYDATYDDLYATQRSAYTATPKPTPAKKPTPQNKAAQEKFDKTFAVTDKSKMEVVEDKVQKGIDDFAKYHQEQTGKPLTQEEYNDAYKDIYNRAYVNAGVYKPTMSGPTINPYGTTKERKNLVSLDPGNAPKNLTLGDYVEKGWDVITNPLDYASYALKPKGTVATPWNMTNYENRLAAAGLEDPVTANNNVNKALDFASWFIGPGMVAQGLKMVPSTVNSIGRAFKDPSWENTRDALFDTGMTALSIVPGFGIAKNLAKRASTLDDLKAIEALRGNTATTPFQSYYLTGNRALGTSEAAVQQAEALRKFTGQQPLELPAGEYQFFNSDYKKLYDELQEAIKKQKIESDELANFDPIAKINQSKVDNKAFKDLIMGDDLKFKFDDYPDSPRIPVRYAGLEQIRPGSGISLNRTDLLPKGTTSSKNPLDQIANLIRRKKSQSELSALDDLDKIRAQSRTGQENAANILDEEIEQKLKDLDTPEGRRRVEKYIKDNNLVIEEYDPGNFDVLVRDIDDELPAILSNKYSDESRRIVDLVRNNMIANKRSPQLMANIKSWNELEPEHILNNPLLNRIAVTDVLAPADPRFTGGIKERPFTHEEYIENIENIVLEDVELQIKEKQAFIKLIEANINKLAVEKNKANSALRKAKLPDAKQLLQFMADYNKKILDEHNKIAFINRDISNLTDRLERNNASFIQNVYHNNDFANLISIGQPHTAIGDIVPAIIHETGHATESVGLKRGKNSAIDRELIAGLDFAKRAPNYLYKKLDPDKVRETAAYDMTFEGVDKYRDPKEYFRRNLDYFKKGNKSKVGMSKEPTAFAVEMRPALKELGLIKGNYDIVTPEIIEQLYIEYLTNPKFQFRDIRIFDIIKPTKRSFKQIAKSYNDIKSLLPYAVPVGLGVGATGLAGQEEMQQDMEYQDGGIIMELSDDEIEQYKKGGWVIEEVYDDGGTTPDLNQFFTVPAKQKVTTKPVVKPAVEPIKRNIQPVNNNEGINQFFTVPTKQTIKNESGVKPVRTIEDISINEILNKYNVSGQSPFLTTADLGNLPKYSEPVEKKKVQSKKPEQIIEDVSVIDILNKYNVSGQSPFLTNEDLQSLPKYTSPKEDVDKRFEQGKKKIKESEAKDSSILEIAGILTNPIMDYFTGPIETGYELAGDAYDLVVNGLKRKARTYGVIDDSDAKVDPLYKTAPLTIDQYYTNQNPIRQQVLEVPDGNGRTFKQQVVPLSNITLGYRNRGEYDNIKTPGLELTTFHPFVSNPKDVKENTSVFAIDDKGNLHTGSYGEFKNNKGWKFSRTYMNKITDITSDFVDGSVSGNPGYKQPKVKVLENGKEKSGSLNILTKGPGKEDYYGSIQGGRVLFVNPKTKEQFLVSGSAQHIRTEFKRLKGNAPYLEAWTLDNGTYSRGLSYKDGKLTPERLKKYDNENTSGGSGLYILDYKAPVTKNKYQESYVKNSPNIRTVNSGSYKSGRPLKNEIKNVVLHHTAFTDEATSEKGVYNHFMNPKSNASAHVVIERNGKRTVYASPEQVAFHAGVSSWNGRKNVNDFAIGVEFQGDTNKMPLTDAQIESFVEYYAPIAERYNLSIKDIITHAMIAPGRKPDITDKEYKRILNYMKQQGYK